MEPENCLHAAFSRIFRALSRPTKIGTWDYDQGFICLQVYKQWYSNLLRTLRSLSAAFGHCSKTYTSISADVIRILHALHRLNATCFA